MAFALWFGVATIVSAHEFNAPHSNPIRMGLYGGPGAILGSHDYPYQKVLSEAGAALGGISITVLKAEAVRQNLTRNNFDIFFVPGGWSHMEAKGLTETGLAAIRSFVASGGGYIGTCAGAFLGMNWELFYGKGSSGKGPPALSLGSGMVQIEFTNKGFQDLPLNRSMFHGKVGIFYQGGPVISAADLPSTVNVLALYRSVVPSELPTPQGLNTPAVTSTTYGAGRVILNSPHAENVNSGNIGPDFYQSELAWVLRRGDLPSKGVLV